jgi:NAD-dependent SIR2 family protein deacetylase
MANLVREKIRFGGTGRLKTVDEVCAYMAVIDKIVEFHGHIIKVLCFGCKEKYEVHEKHPWVCPRCKHDNKEE